MRTLTLTPHDRIDAGDIMVALQDASKGLTSDVLLYALAKSLALSFANFPVRDLTEFIDDLKTTAVVCYEHPTEVPPEE